MQTQGLEVTLFNYARHHGLGFPMNIAVENSGLFTKDFLEWLPNNTHVFAEFCKRAIAIRKRGRKHYGAKTIVEVIRFETDVISSPDETFKINNNYTAYLARLCMIIYPVTEGLFETRIAKAVYNS